MASNLTRTEVCQLLGVSPKSLYLWERDGHIPHPRRDRRNWRVYSPADVAAIRRFLGTGFPEERERPHPRRNVPRVDGLSARNQLVGTVVALHRDGLLCEVVVRLGDGQEITSVITARSAERLGLRKGREVTAVIKATEVMVFR
jgi:molybdopterin-binding protein